MCQSFVRARAKEADGGDRSPQSSTTSPSSSSHNRPPPFLLSPTCYPQMTIPGRPMLDLARLRRQSSLTLTMVSAQGARERRAHAQATRKNAEEHAEHPEGLTTRSGSRGVESKARGVDNTCVSPGSDHQGWIVQRGAHEKSDARSLVVALSPNRRGGTRGVKRLGAVRRGSLMLATRTECTLVGLGRINIGRILRSRKMRPPPDVSRGECKERE